MLFWGRVMRLGDQVPVERLLVSNRETPLPWALALTKAVMPERLTRGILWNVDGARQIKLKPGVRQNLSTEPVLPPTRFVCFQAMLQKTLDYPNDALDIAHIRAAAYRSCGVVSDAAAPSYVLLETRGTSNTTSRRIANFGGTRELLRTYARKIGLPLEVKQFSSQMSYCDQVKVAANARLFFGVHGMAQENAMFMRPGSVLIELFHTSYAAELRGGNVGREQLFRGSDMQYASAALLESDCSLWRGNEHECTCSAALSPAARRPACSALACQSGWKFDPQCPSIVNLDKLATFLAAVTPHFTAGGWPGRTAAASTGDAETLS